MPPRSPRQFFLIVAIIATILGLILHVHAVIRTEDDFAPAILIIEATGAAILLAMASAIGLLVHLVNRDAAYAARLRRRLEPEAGPWISKDGLPQGEPK
ncbi:hypothetical protein [Aquisphaera insulae]|uniref:hypothetical protein n=1 Tax=Aquisphaera insulae TaxID=2712864 RepID=UPI0013EC3DE9|nr:hypothetical protein [Aquisphaera insulae]